MESEYIRNVRSDKHLSSSFRSDTRLQIRGRGMHSNIAVKSVLGPYSHDAIMDLLYVFQIPSSAYIDVHEIESRFEFPWNVVNIHARSDNVDYESIYTGKVNDSTIGIEFVGVPLKAWSYGDGLFQWTFEMPLHLRYQMPALDSSQSFGIVTIHAPLLYIRSYHDRTCTVAYQDSEACSSYTQSLPLMNSKRRYTRYYDTSFLGNKGNSESIADDFHALNSQFDSTARYERPQEVHTDAIDAVFANYSKEVVLSMPLGNAEDLPIVLWTTFAVTLLTTVGLLLLMIRKALGSSRRLENKVEEL